MTGISRYLYCWDGPTLYKNQGGVRCEGDSSIIGREKEYIDSNDKVDNMRNDNIDKMLISQQRLGNMKEENG